MTPPASDQPQLNIFALLWLRLRTHPPALLLLITFIVGAVFFSIKIYHHLITNNHQKAVEQAATAIASTQASKVNSYLKHQQQQINTIIENPQVIEALQLKDYDQLAKLESRLVLHRREAERLHLLTPGSNKLETSENFVAHELAKRAFAGEKLNPEAIKLKDGWYLLFIATVKDRNQGIIGVAIHSVAAQALMKTLQTESQQGQTVLFQQLPGLRGKAIITTGQKLDNLSTVEKPTQLPYWKIRFTGNQVLLNETSPLSQDVLIIFISLGAVLLLLLILGLRTILLRYKHEPIPAPKEILAPLEDEFEQQEESSYLEITPLAPAEKDEPATDPTPATSSLPDVYPEVIFRDYDIRGIYGKQLDATFARQLGGCLGTKALAEEETTLVIGWDGRLSSPELKEALQTGILETGCNVISLGAVPTPLLTFALDQLNETSSGVMVTASHNLASDNGFKIFFKQHALCGEEITTLRDAMLEGDFRQGNGRLEELDLSSDYTAAIVKDVVPAMDLKVVLDAGNGIAGKFAVDVLEGIGCSVTPLYCEVNGNFPHHPPDTAVAENLRDLREAVTATNAQLGIGLDGDGDRVVAITANGDIVWPDELMMIFARDVLSRHPGSDIVFDIKCTRRLSPLIRGYGGRPVMWKTGHSHMRNKIMECEAPLGGEFSGHIFFRDRWHGSDDAIYAAARLIEIMSVREQSLADILAAYETSCSTAEIKIIVPDDRKFELVEAFIKDANFGDAQLSAFDGLRVDFPNAWGLVRASNTSPALTLRFEAESEASLEKIKSLFRQQLSSIDSSLTF